MHGPRLGRKKSIREDPEHGVVLSQGSPLPPPSRCQGQRGGRPWGIGGAGVEAGLIQGRLALAQTLRPVCTWNPTSFPMYPNSANYIFQLASNFSSQFPAWPLAPSPQLPPHGLHVPAYSSRTPSPSVLRTWTPSRLQALTPGTKFAPKDSVSRHVRHRRFHQEHGLGLGLCFPACPGPRTPPSTPPNRHRISDPTPTLSPTQSAVPTPDSISQHAQGLRLPLPVCSKNRTTFPHHAWGGGLSPGKGPCSCCKFPKIFWLSRWMRRVTTWVTEGRRSSETREATVRVLPGRLGPRYFPKALL